MTTTPTPSDRPTDEELLRRHVAGDRRGFDELAGRYMPELFRFLSRMLGQPAWVEDAIQETLLQVHLSAGTFDATRRVKPWVFTIAANKARDLLRSRARRREVYLDAAGNDDESADLGALLGVEAPPGDGFEQRDQALVVRGVVGELPESLREVLVLAYFHQFAYREIADILGIPIGTVKSRLHAAVRQFSAAYRRATGAQPDQRPAVPNRSDDGAGGRHE